MIKRGEQRSTYEFYGLSFVDGHLLILEQVTHLDSPPISTKHCGKVILKHIIGSYV